MADRNALAEAVSGFLRSRRDRLTPEHAGLPSHGRRRVPGLRRTEVAALAGVSVEYYTRLERGELRGASAGVLDALASALALDPVERRYLLDLAAAANAGTRRDDPPAEPTSELAALLPVIDAMADLPAFVTDRQLDVLAANQLGRALYAPMLADPNCGSNIVRWTFLDPAAHTFYADWEQMARFGAGALRAESARRPDDQRLHGLIADLSGRSQEFRTAGAEQDVNLFPPGKRLRHPAVGLLDLRLETLISPGDGDLAVVVLLPTPDTSATDGLRILATWAADQPAQVRPASRRAPSRPSS